MPSLASSYSKLIYGMMEIFENCSGENFAEYQLMASKLFSSPFLIPMCRDTPWSRWKALAWVSLTLCFEHGWALFVRLYGAYV